MLREFKEKVFDFVRREQPELAQKKENEEE